MIKEKLIKLLKYGREPVEEKVKKKRDWTTTKY